MVLARQTSESLARGHARTAPQKNRQKLIRYVENLHEPDPRASSNPTQVHRVTPRGERDEKGRLPGAAGRSRDLPRIGPAGVQPRGHDLGRSSVLLTNVVVRFEPFRRTTDEATKFVPVTVSVNPAPPAVALLGDSVAGTGTG